MDEKEIDSTQGSIKKGFTTSSSYHGGFVGTSTTNGMSKHITAVVSASGSAEKSPPFFIVGGKNVMSHWVEPLPCSIISSVTCHCHVHL